VESDTSSPEPTVPRTTNSDAPVVGTSGSESIYIYIQYETNTKYFSVLFIERHESQPSISTRSATVVNYFVLLVN